MDIVEMTELYLTQACMAVKYMVMYRIDVPVVPRERSDRNKSKFKIKLNHRINSFLLLKLGLHPHLLFSLGWYSPYILIPCKYCVSMCLKCLNKSLFAYIWRTVNAFIMFL
jgi:hypothetical protein